MRALVAEDDAATRTVIQDALRSQGYEVITVADGNETWDVLSNPHAPRLVVLNWHMPGLDGPEICRRVRQREGGQHVYVLMMTNGSGGATVTEALEAGADDFVNKSVSMAELAARLLPARRFVRVCEEIIEFKESMRRQAPYDVLTGLDNRVTILDFLNKEVARSNRHNAPMSVVLVAIDHWTSLNETYGRRTGDGVLCTLARRMEEIVRPYDLVGRFGDEEFLVVAPGCDASGAAEFGERIRTSLTGQTVRVQGKLVAITASLGAADNAVCEDPDGSRLVDEARAALQRARTAGGNRVDVAARQPVPAA